MDDTIPTGKQDPGTGGGVKDDKNVPPKTEEVPTEVPTETPAETPVEVPTETPTDEKPVEPVTPVPVVDKTEEEKAPPA